MAFSVDFKESINLDGTAGNLDLLALVKATDDSGLDEAYFEFTLYDENGSQVDYQSFYINDYDIANGTTINNGTFIDLIGLDSGATNGKYVLTEFSIRDQAENEKTYEGDRNLTMKLKQLP